MNAGCESDYYAGSNAATEVPNLGKPLVDHLGDGHWELRSRLPNRIARTLFTIVRSEVIVLHGFIKKSQKTPARELELARRRKRIYEQSYEQQ